MKNKWLILLVLVLAFSPIVLLADAPFMGADSAALEEIEASNPHYEPWFKSIFEPSSSEVESFLFALQAAIGAGFIGYVIGLFKGRQGRSSKP